MNNEYSCWKDKKGTEELEEKVRKRIYTFEQFFNKFKTKGLFEGTHLELGLLRNAVESYFIDLERTKCFHDIKYADTHKKAAFTIKWLVKIRPIQINQTGKQINENQILANEIFALFAAFNFLELDIEKVSDKFYRNLLYIFRYRDIECLTLASKMYLLEKAYKGQVP